MTIQEKIKQFTLEFDPILENEISQLVDQQLEFHPAQTVLDAQLKFNIQEYAKNGKRVRPFLISFFAGKNLADRDLLHMAVASELFHLAALLQDDVMDASKIRRGVPTLNAIGDNLSRNNSHLGDHVGVLLGDVFLTRSIEFASRLPEPIFKEFITMIQRTTRGQYLDAFGMNEDYGTSSLEDVLARHDLKTAWYTFASPARIGYMLSDNPDQGTLEVLSTTVRELGLLFQIRDD
ncbi:MAG: geranylgeranyl diphosphate synthase type I, partial [Saprospiraceae bacterium]